MSVWSQRLLLGSEHVSGAERREFPLPTYVGVHFFAPLLKIIPDSSAQRPLSAHLKFNSLHEEGAIPDVAPIWPVCLLFEIFYKLHLSTNDLLEGTRESVWTCACPRLVESSIRAELEWNGTIALAFGLAPTIFHTVCSPLAPCSAPLTCPALDLCLKV